MEGSTYSANHLPRHNSVALSTGREHNIPAYPVFLWPPIPVHISLFYRGCEYKQTQRSDAALDLRHPGQKSPFRAIVTRPGTSDQCQRETRLLSPTCTSFVSNHLW
jgi:hypothetical protein